MSPSAISSASVQPATVDFALDPPPSLDPPAATATAAPLQLPDVTSVPAVAAATRQRHGDLATHRRLIARDFRTDTITVPTDELFEVAREASRGDDVYEEDLTTLTFQAEVAALAGKESGLFVASGTLSNQLALRTHLVQPPYSILCDVRSHVHRYEAGGAAFHSGAAAVTVQPSNGHHLRWREDILPNLVLGDDCHTAPTRVVCLENSLNGLVFPQEEAQKIGEGCRELGVALHLDGARVWNVLAETGKPLQELLAPFDTVSCCFSKGLGAPVGSMLLGPERFIRKARHFRKLFGAGMRQTGGLAAQARHCLVHNLGRLRATHELARWTQRQLESLGVEVLSGAETNMIFIDPSPLGFDASELSRRASELKPLPLTLGGGTRLVFHHQLDPASAVELVRLVASLRREFAPAAKKRQAEGEDEGDASKLSVKAGGGGGVRDTGANLYAGMKR